MMKAENRFTCDRCHVNVSVVVQNTPHRSAPPDGWTTIHIEDAASVVLHLCPACTDAFHLMMMNSQ